MELKDYWQTIRRRWVLVAATFLVVVGAAAAVTWTATPLYASNAKLFVSTQSADAATAIQGGQFATQRVSSYAEQVGYSSLAEEVSQSLGGAVDAETLQEEISAQVSPDTVNIVITATDPDPIVARDVAQAYAEALSRRIESLETPQGRDNPLVKASIADNAEVDTEPVSPQPMRNLGLGAVLGLLLGVGIAVLRETLDTTVSSDEDIASVTDVPILGHINADSTAVKKESAAALRESTPWAEAFRVLRTNMQFVEVDHEKRMFVVSSALPGEGKSTTSSNLAITLAMTGQRVALIDCDLRRPVLATRLGLDAAVGTTSVLIGKVKLDDALQALGETGVEVLTSGPIPPNPSELLQSHAMSDLIRDLREDFDVVLIDAPPLLPVTDSALLAAQTDGLMLVTRHGRTTREQVRHAVERVEAVDAKTVGVVINAAPVKKAGGAYGYGYGYGAQSAEPARRFARHGRRRAVSTA